MAPPHEARDWIAIAFWLTCLVAAGRAIWQLNRRKPDADGESSDDWWHRHY